MNNRVELIGFFGGDMTHALSAWTSTDRDLTEEKRNRVDKLLKFLADNKHTSPFEKSYLHFLVTCETASHIHILKHRIGVSVNGESARYKELVEDKYYIPEDWPEHIKFVVEERFKADYEIYHWLLGVLEQEGFSRKRAKESARFVLPYANQLTLDVGFNFKSFMHFQGLRNKEDAQDEIHWIARDMLRAVRDTGEFNDSLTAFGY